MWLEGEPAMCSFRWRVKEAEGKKITFSRSGVDTDDVHISVSTKMCANRHNEPGWDEAKRMGRMSLEWTSDNRHLRNWWITVSWDRRRSTQRRRKAAGRSGLGNLLSNINHKIKLRCEQTSTPRGDGKKSLRVMMRFGIMAFQKLIPASS